MKPLQHAKISAKKYGGKWEDYIKIHQWFDQTKAHVADMRHRAILHNSFGIMLCSQVFGEVMVNSSGREVSVRDIGEDHVLQDLNKIPSLAEVINAIGTQHLKWLGGGYDPKNTGVKRIDFGQSDGLVGRKKEACETLYGDAETAEEVPAAIRALTED